MARRLENYKPEDEHEVQRGRRVYVRFARAVEKHTGPFFGPYAELEIRDTEVIGVTATGRQELIAKKMPRGWDLPGRSEPPYPGFTVVPS